MFYSTCCLIAGLPVSVFISLIYLQLSKLNLSVDDENFLTRSQLSAPGPRSCSVSGGEWHVTDRM